jgi:hypothetical protein
MMGNRTKTMRKCNKISPLRSTFLLPKSYGTE